MKAFGRICRLAVILALAAGLWIVVPSAGAVPAMIHVNTTEDTVSSNGNCSLREAVQAANTNAMVDTCNGVLSDIIGFNIGAAGSSQTITLTSSLTITTTVTLDGTTQPGYVATPLIHIAGNGTSVWLSLNTNAHNSVVRGLRFSQPYPGPGKVWALVIDADNIQIKSNHFNTDGTAQVGSNALGIWLADSSNSTVGGPVVTDRNLFGGSEGIRLSSGTGNMIQGNYFGVQTGGNTMLGSMDSTGVAILLAPDGGVPSGNTIRDNVIAKYAYGISLTGATTGTLIYGNHIGVGANGTAALGNGTGIYVVGSSGNTIGGTTAADRNVISASTNTANIKLTDDMSNDSDNNIIQGNYIGTTADGVTGLSPTVTGILIDDGDNTTIGGNAAGAGNVISGNLNGITVDVGNTGTIIRGNMVGTEPTGTMAVGNGNTGIYLASTANLGDAVTPGKNLIGGHTSGMGILINGALGVDIYGNWIGINAAGSSAFPNAIGVSIGYGGSATVVRNWIAFNTQYGVLFDETSTSAPSSQNCFNSNAVAVRNQNTAITAPFANNWWGNSTGPTHSGNVGGTGDPVSDYVGYYPWRSKPAAACSGTIADFDGDATSDAAVFDKAAGNWFVLGSTDGFYSPALNFGGNAADYLAVPGDYDGDGNTDAAVFQKATGNWFVIGTTDGFFTPALGFGNFTDFWPVPADYDGDGKTDPAVVHRTNGNWFVVGSTDGFYSPALNFGDASFIPVPADYDADGKADAAMYAKTAGNWFVVGSTDGFFTPALSFGGTGYIPVPEDYDGDGTADPAVFHETAGNWFVIGSADGFYSPALNFGGTTATFTPLPADYDGDGKTDPAAFDRAAGNWFVIGSTDGFFMPALNFGGNASVYRPVVGSWWLTELATD